MSNDVKPIEYNADDKAMAKEKFGSTIIFGLLFFPSLIVATAIFFLLRFGRLRLSVIAPIVLAVDAILLMLFFPLDFWGMFVSSVMDLGNFASNWMNMIPFLLVFYTVIGSIVGLFIVAWEIRQMKLQPHRLVLPGTWYYNFKFRRTPLEIMRKNKIIERMKDGSLGTLEKSPLGLNEHGKYQPVFRYLSEAQKHTLIVGNTGSGKTITMQNLILNDIRNGVATVIIDMKKTPSFASKISTWAEECGADFYHFMNGAPDDYDIPNSPGQSYYDPLKIDDRTAKADMVLNFREWDTASEVYRTEMQNLVQGVFAMLDHASDKVLMEVATEYDFVNKKTGNKIDKIALRNKLEKMMLEEYRSKSNDPDSVKSVHSAELNKRLSDILNDTSKVEKVARSNIDRESGGVYELATAISGSNILRLAEACQGTEIEDKANEIAMMVQDKKASKEGINHAIKKLQGQMRTILISTYGRWLKTPKGDQRNIDLYELTKTPGKVILFSLNSDSEPDFARFMGSMIMSDLTNVSAKRRNKQLSNPVSVYIDEFQTVNPSSVTSLLEKSRESKIALTLAQQSFEQIIAASSHNGESNLNSVLDTCSNFIVHAGSTESSANRLAGIIGKDTFEAYRSASKNESFFMSMNWANRNLQTVQTYLEERYKFGPEKFMNLSSPVGNNDYKSTAVFINKTCSDPLFKEVEGAVARTVWMIPDSKVLENYYVAKLENTEVEIEYEKKHEKEVMVNDFDNLLVVEEQERGSEIEDRFSLNFVEKEKIVEQRVNTASSDTRVEKLVLEDEEGDEDEDGGWEFISSDGNVNDVDVSSYFDDDDDDIDIDVDKPLSVREEIPESSDPDSFPVIDFD